MFHSIFFTITIPNTVNVFYFIHELGPQQNDVGTGNVFYSNKQRFWRHVFAFQNNLSHQDSAAILFSATLLYKHFNNKEATRGVTKN